MKIAMVTPEFLSWGGIGSYTMQLAKHLPDEFEMHLICLNGSDCLCDIDVHSLGESKDTFFCNGQFQYRLWRSFKKLQNENKFDIIHANHAQMPDILMKLNRNGVPSITTVHSTIGSQRLGTKNSAAPVERLEKSERMTYALYPLLSATEKFYLKRSPNLIFVSEYIRDWCIDKIGVGTDSNVIPNGIDADVFSHKEYSEAIQHFPRLDGIENIVLFSGRMIALKGIETAILAKKNLDDKACFVFAGNGDASRWISYAHTIGLDDNECIFLGPVAYQEMPYLYSLASAFILPSFSESFPLTILEAMSCGVPVIASNVGGVPEIVQNEKDAMLINAGDSQELAKAVSRILVNDNFVNDIKINSRNKILDKFNVETMARNTANAYIKAIGESK
ncbi:glycosyltransferase family 4 protein [Candidatus Methanomassiliicoccus intestinalis]|uniref:glycosyltransferase family 4 protein n=1 Tax=Candidatus Methanomassiliicoccus intestinalis TaxID=1406512 RepID=UPI0037DCF956